MGKLITFNFLRTRCIWELKRQGVNSFGTGNILRVRLGRSDFVKLLASISLNLHMVSLQPLKYSLLA